MKVAIASGKGGTGKTTIATNLAVAAARAGLRVHYLDCDVEEPNGHLYLKPFIISRKNITVPVPRVDAAKCTGCGECGRICQYSAIIAMGKTVLTFEELCHSCGGCSLACPAGAITEKQISIGTIESGCGQGVGYAGGTLSIGSVRSPALIKQVRQTACRDNELVLIDAPPGTTCPTVEAIRHAEMALLVTEPTPFGLSDLKAAVEMVRLLEVPLAVIVNKADDGELCIDDYCREQGIEIIARIGESRKLAQLGSRGEMIIDVPGIGVIFEGMLKTILAGATR